MIKRGTSKEILKEIGTLLKTHPGKETVEIHIENGGPPKVLKLPYTVDYSPEVQKKVRKLTIQ